MKLDNCSVLLPLRSNPQGDLRREVLGSLLGGDIRKVRSNRMYVTAVNKVSLDISQGDRIGIIGRNGSGKTSLLKTLAGVYLPQEGKIDIRGRIVSLLTLGYGMEGELSGYANIPNLCIQFGLDIRDTQNKLDEIIEFSELGDFFFQPIKVYSSGMKLRLLLAVATLSAPDILLMDEWFGTGDIAFRNKADQKISELMKKTGIIILASHSAGLLNKWTTKTIWMDKGKLMEFGPSEIVTQKYMEFATK